ncbi:MAG: hypothetical protein QOD87_2374 [Pseudonocardiales bacterium]|jgi:DNA-binding MarR family transcriptional regulator|nr:hypothetical protein [Pseudonocardiales bacterium]
MGKAADDRLVNLVGALATGIVDASVTDIALSGDLDTTACAALVTMLELVPYSSAHRLSQLCGVSHSGAVRMVNRLVEAGYVQRGPGPDRRTVTVTLTKRGQRAAQWIRDARHQAIATTLSSLTARQRTQLTGIAEVLVASLTSSRLAQRQAGAVPSGGALCRMCDPSACGRPAGHCPTARTAGGTRSA